MAFAINDREQIVGCAQTASGDTHAFLWESGKMTDLGTLGGPNSIARAINNQGQIVGGSRTSHHYQHAFLYERGVMRDLGTLGGKNSEAKAIDNAGNMAGWSNVVNCDIHAFRIHDGRMTDLACEGEIGCQAESIKDANKILVTTDTGDGEIAQIEIGDKWRNLNTLVPARFSWRVTEAVASNAHGQIVANGTATGITHAVLLTPR